MTDSTQKRRNIAEKTVTAATQFVDALNQLLELKEERAKLDGGFVDADFETDGLRHLSPGLVGTLFDFVVPDLQANYVDNDDNGGRNEQILLQVRK